MGRPATGRTTKTVRVPLDMDVEFAVTAYYDIIPLLIEAKRTLRDSPRYDRLKRLLEQMDLPDAGGGEKTHLH